jgi:hypothetical protein
VTTQVRLIATLNTEIEQLGEVVAAHFGRHRDAERYPSLLGLGTVLGARILGEFGDDPHRVTDAKRAATTPAPPPITRASGRKVYRGGDGGCRVEACLSGADAGGVGATVEGSPGC